MKKTLFLLTFFFSFLCSFGQRNSVIFDNGMEVFEISENGLHGVQDTDGKTIVPNLYKYLYFYGNMIFCLRKEGTDNFYDLYNSQGECIIKDSAKTLDFCKINGHWVASTDYLKHVEDENGNSTFTFDNLVKSNTIKGIYDENGNLQFVNKIYNDPTRGYYVVNQLTDSIIVPPNNYDEISFSFTSCLIRLRKNNKEGIANYDGSILVPCEYNHIQLLNSYNKEHLYFKVSNNEGNQGIVSVNGTVIISPDRYDVVDLNYNKGYYYFKVQKNRKKGICDSNGNEILEPTYDDAKILNGKIVVKTISGEGAVDNNGINTIPCIFTKVIPEEDQGSDNYRVYISDKVGVMKSDGSVIVPIQYDRISKYTTGIPFESVYEVGEGSSKGIYTGEGRMLFPTKLFKMVDIKKGQSGVKFNADWYIKAYNSLGDNYYYDFDGNLLYHENMIRDLSNLVNQLSTIEEIDNFCKEALLSFNQRDYKKAIKYYEKALTFQPGNGEIYYNIAAAYYNLGKYKNAIEYLQKCARSDAPLSLKEDANNMIEECKAFLQEKKERNKEMWCSVISNLFNVGSALIQYNMSLKAQNNISRYVNNGNRYFNRDTSYDYLLDPMLALQQVQQQYYNEYLQMTNGGRTMTYKEWFENIKGPALAEEYRIEHGLSEYITDDDDNSDSNVEYKGELSPDQYESAYRRWENIVQGWFDNLTLGGVQVQDSKGNITGKTDGDMKGWAYVGNKSGLRRAQNEMKKIRNEAAKYGLIIAQSKWETATASY